MKGRKVGNRRLSLDEINKIAELTQEGESRGNIAKSVGRCKMTVYLWQKKLDLQ